MYLGYKYRINPTAEKKKQLASVFGVVRFVYNWGLSERIKAHKDGKKYGYAACSRDFTKLRCDPEYSWLKDVRRDVEDRSLRNLEGAYRRFFKLKRGFPAFQKKTASQSATFRSKDSGFKIIDDKLILPKVGFVDVVWSRALPSKPIQVTISKTPSGKYYASFLVEVPDKNITKRTRSIGVDLGIKSFLTLSNGELVENPRHGKGLQKKLAKAQRVMSRKDMGSNRRQKQKIKVAKLHEQIANRRADYQHKVARSLVRRFDRIYIEDLNVAGMVKNHNLARAISDVSFGALRRILEYKARLYGKQVIPVGRFFPSSKLCSACGLKNETLTLADRVWTCPCGATHDRDINAAKNILAAGLAVTARGATIALQRSVNSKEMSNNTKE